MRDASIEHFRVSPDVLLPLGVEQLQDPALAVLELIKNSWDADATRVRVTIDPSLGSGRIVVSDNGHGMSSVDFRKRWLVIGTTEKRRSGKTPGGRPLIGEKGLGRLATFALGKVLRIVSSRDSPAFSAVVDWDQLRRASSIEEYSVRLTPEASATGTVVTVEQLSNPWTEEQTELLTTHAEFLTAVPGEKFAIALRINDQPHKLANPTATISRLAQAKLEVQIAKDGRPRVIACSVDTEDMSHLAFREMKSTQWDPRLAGASIIMQFFRRDEASKQLRESLQSRYVASVLERYQGIRIFRDGINVPPYGHQGDDWAGLERQRTQTGGPTMVPGNSQLVGEVHIGKAAHRHLIITAGRSGFADQNSVSRLVAYVRWAAKALGTARRGYHLKIFSGSVPGRVDTDTRRRDATVAVQLRTVAQRVAKSRVARQHAEVRQLATLSEQLLANFATNEETLRLYAQLASTGIAATSFAHELRTEFDVISEAVAELSRDKAKLDQELVSLLRLSWERVRAFAALFHVIPVKMRRRPKLLSAESMQVAAAVVAGLASPDKITAEIKVDSHSARVVPAELDSVLLNLVTNAIKAIQASPTGDSGKLRVAIRSFDKDLLVEVADSGCGISPRVRRVMFSPLEGSFAEGTGMGLAIVKFIAERYDGLVELDDKPPKGYRTNVRVSLRGVVQ